MYVQTTVGRYCLDYTAADKARGTALYLHGLGGNNQAWRHFRALTLATGYHFLAPDLPGHGHSYRPKYPFSWSEFKQGLSEVLESRVTPPLIVVGHCLGAILALFLAGEAELAKSIRALVLFNPSLTVTPGVHFMHFISHLAPLMPVWHRSPYLNYDDFIDSGDFNLRRLGADLVHTGLGSYFTQLGFLTELLLTMTPPKLTQPLTLVSGSQDRIFPVWQQKDLIKRWPQAQHLLLKTNHISIFNRSAQTQAIVRRHLEVVGAGQIDNRD